MPDNEQTPQPKQRQDHQPGTEAEMAAAAAGPHGELEGQRQAGAARWR